MRIQLHPHRLQPVPAKGFAPWIIARRAAPLHRAEHHAEALALVAPLLHDELRTESWPQVWTTLRILAELLAELDRVETAALLLAAARAAPAAPTIKGDDVERYRTLDAHIAQRLGPDVVDRITALARTLARARAVDAALVAVRELSTPGSGRGPTAPA